MKKLLFLATLAFVLVLSAPQPAAGAPATFTLSTTWSNNNSSGDPDPVDTTSTIVIDTATGQVVSSNVTASGLAGSRFALPFQSQQSVTGGFTLLTFNGAKTLSNGETVTITLQVYLPVASLVGYSGGVLGDSASLCPAGTLFDPTNEVIQCSGSACQYYEQGTFSANYGELIGPQTKLTTFRVSATDFCTSVPVSLRLTS